MLQSEAERAGVCAATLACHSEGQGPPLVLLHGGMGSWTHWIRNIPALRARYTVHALDLPGCGDTPLGDADIDTTGYLELVRAAVLALTGSGKVGIVGFSFGGVVGAMLAASMPQQVGRLALLAPGGFGRVTGRPLDLRKMPEAAADEAVRREVLRHNLMAMMFARPETADDAAIEIQRWNVARTRYDSRRFSLSPFTREALPRIAAPTLLVYGTRDNLAWPSVDARIDACLALKPDIRVERIPEAGHWVQYEAASEVNRLLLDFFG